MTKSTHLESWETKLVQVFQEGLIPIFTKSWRIKNIFNYLNNHKLIYFNLESIHLKKEKKKDSVNHKRG